MGQPALGPGCFLGLVSSTTSSPLYLAYAMFKKVFDLDDADPAFEESLEHEAVTYSMHSCAFARLVDHEFTRRETIG